MKSLAKNYFLNLSYQILVVVLPLVTAPYLARVLGPDRIGEYSFMQSIVSYFALFSVLGTSLYGQKMIAGCHARGESKTQLFVELVLLRALNVAVALGCYFAVIFPQMDNPTLCAVAAIEILAVAFDISWFFQGIEQFQNITLCSGIAKLAGAASIFIFVKSRADLSAYVVCLCGSALLGNAAQWLFVRPCLERGVLARPSIGQHYRPALSLFISQFAIQAYTVLDKTMIGLITRSDFENGYYDQTQNLIHALVTLVTSIGTVMASRITILWNSDETRRHDAVQELVLFSFRLVFALGLPIAAGTILISSRFVPIYYGDQYDPVIPLMRMLAIIVPIIGCSNITGMQLFVPTGRERLLTRAVAVGAIVNVALNALLISWKGALGAAAASVLAELTVTLVQIFYARCDVDVKQIARLLLRYALLTAVIVAVGMLVSSIAPAGLRGMLAVVAACVATYLALLLGLRDPVLKLFKM